MKGGDTELVTASKDDTNKRDINDNKFCTADTEPVEDVFDVEKGNAIADRYEDKQEE